jgi:hypothetical protein
VVRVIAQRRNGHLLIVLGVFFILCFDQQSDMCVTLWFLVDGKFPWPSAQAGDNLQHVCAHIHVLLLHVLGSEMELLVQGVWGTTGWAVAPDGTWKLRTLCDKHERDIERKKIKNPSI